MLFFESWAELGRTLLSALLIYPFIILSVRVVGKRSTSKMNNFDWIVTVALGSMVGSTVILKDVVILEAYLAIGALLSLQYVLTKITVHYPQVLDTVRDQPTLLFYEGTFNEKAMTRERVSRKEIEANMRTAGFGDLNDVRAVILEADAGCSILAKEGHPPGERTGDENDLLRELEDQELREQGNGTDAQRTGAAASA